jgi:hypothetical protein
MFHTIMVAYDESREAAHALASAIELVRRARTGPAAIPMRVVAGPTCRQMHFTRFARTGERLSSIHRNVSAA